MNDTRQIQRYLEIISGQARGPGATAARAGLTILEPAYRAVIAIRNSLYDRQYLKSHRIGCPVISVGNLTTGGTGKTPVVRWLADRLRHSGHRPAVLMRGYKAAGGNLGDEQSMLQDQLNSASGPPVWVHANPDRVAGAKEMLRAHPEISAFILDDGFQHRRIARDLDIVLIDATNPFGFGHVLPRGLLRESLRGLKRAGAVLITHADEIEPDQLQRLTSKLRDRSAQTPIFRCAHKMQNLPDDLLKSSQKVLAFCGTGNPDSFFAGLRRMISSNGELFERRFDDHHRYTNQEAQDLLNAATSSKAAALITTEKDWVKLRLLPAILGSALPIYRADVQIELMDQDATSLLGLVLGAVKSGSLVSGGRVFGR